jgi:death-on-curing family protein
VTDPRPIIYLTAGEVIAFHAEIMRRAGQPPTLLRDHGLLESAVQRPQNAAYYEEADIVTQAALYMVGIALNHPFVDGNKRAGYIAGMTFLLLNGYVDLDASLNDPELGFWLEHFVDHEMTFEVFIRHLNERLQERLIQP